LGASFRATVELLTRYAIVICIEVGRVARVPLQLCLCCLLSGAEARAVKLLLLGERRGSEDQREHPKRREHHS
jgi:hypothetical protein